MDLNRQTAYSNAPIGSLWQAARRVSRRLGALHSMPTPSKVAKRSQNALKVALVSALTGAAFAATAHEPDAFAFSTLHVFKGKDGQYIDAPPTLGPDGLMYGVAEQGGRAGCGVFFRLEQTGTVTRLHEFAEAEGCVAQAALTLGNDGNFYGVTDAGGANGLGTVFKMTPAGTLTTLHSFAGSPADGSRPGYAALLKASDGHFYGVTGEGGSQGSGIAFRISSSGEYAVIHNFDLNASDGAAPRAALMQASNGDLYGTTSWGGTRSGGTVFRMSLTGDLTTLHSFSNETAELAGPWGGLVQAADGYLYGTVVNGGPTASGAVFRIGLSGGLVPLALFPGGPNFGNRGGRYPMSTLVQCADGALYGTTYFGGKPDGSYGMGTVYRITPDGALSYTHAFRGKDGRWPQGGLTKLGDCSLYGSTTRDTKSDSGTLFLLTPTSNGTAPR